MKWTPIVAIIVVGALLGYALHLGHDNLLLIGGIAVISGLGGYEAKTILSFLRPKK